ncbi:MAG: YciI family protein [Bryobacteraceae bacterium]
MQFLLLIYDREARAAQRTEAENAADYQAFADFGKEFATAIQGGEALQPTPSAKTVRVRDGKPLVTDGPFAETKEQLGGYYLVEAKDIDTALAIAAKIPWARFGSIEVRPIMKFS